MVQRKSFYLSVFTAGATTLLLAFNNCSTRDAGATSGSVDLASAGCKVDPDVLVSQVKDGDYNVQVYLPESESHNFSEKLYLNDLGDPAKAPRWKTNVIDWYYNPAKAPANLAATALATLQSSMAVWSNVCGVKFNYLGTTTKGATSATTDAANVLAWGDADGATGITYSHFKGNTAPWTITESDINFNVGDIFDSTTLKAVANHELGHMLGLAHSDVSVSIMFANPYHDVPYLLTLRPDDIAGCVGLYGPPGTATPTPTPAPTATPTATPTPAPTATPRPSATPVPTATPRPSATPAPGATPGSTPVASQGC